ncbi:MAG: hypothetical protein R3F02_12355 [Thiolinea sp.]
MSTEKLSSQVFLWKTFFIVSAILNILLMLILTPMLSDRLDENMAAHANWQEMKELEESLREIILEELERQSRHQI